MDKEMAGYLAEELKRQFRTIAVDKGLFADVLAHIDVTESTRFYELVPENEQPVHESHRSCYLSLKRVLRNKNMRDYQLSGWKRCYEAATSVLGLYSSDVLSRRVRANRELVEMMAGCGQPFSLLGKFKIYDYDNPNKTFIITRPVLIIPAVTDTKPIRDWEQANTIYEKETCLFRQPKRIRPQEYLS